MLDAPELRNAEDALPVVKGRSGPHRGRKRRVARLIALEAVAACVLVALAFAGFLAWALSRGPVSLEVIRPTVERALSEARGGQAVEIERLALEWSVERARLQAVAFGVTARNSAGEAAAEADRAVIGLDLSSLLQGRLKVKALGVERGSLVFRRSREGVWSLAGVRLFEEPKTGRAFNPFMDLRWRDVATPLRAALAAGDFSRVDVADLGVRVVDEASRTVWSAPEVDGSWRADGEGVQLGLSLKLSQAFDANLVRLELGSDPGVTRAVGSLTLEGVDPLLVASWFGYRPAPQATAPGATAPGATAPGATAPGATAPSEAPAAQATPAPAPGALSAAPPSTAVLSAPAPARSAAASFSVTLSEAAGLEQGRISLQDASGAITLLGYPIDVADLDFEATYDPVSQYITLASAEIVSNRVSGRFTGAIGLGALSTAMVVGGSAPINLSAENLVIDAAPMFAGPWTVGSLEAAGELDWLARRVKLTTLRASAGAFSLEGAGEAWIGEHEGKDKPALKLEARSTGYAVPEDVLAFWPVNLGAAAREWAKLNIRGGRATDAVLTVDWPPGANAQGFLPDEHLTLDFNMEGATIGYLSDFPPITEARGSARLRGNSLEATLVSGSVGGWEIDEGRVVLPRFHPGGALLEVTGAGRGSLSDLMRTLNTTNLRVADAYGFDVDRMSGEGGLELVVRQEMRTTLDPEALQLSVRGGFLSASAPDLAAGFGLSEANVRVDLDQDSLVLSGGGRFGPSPVLFTWKEDFEAAAGSGSELSATAVVTPDLLNAFGVAVRNVMQGEAQLDLRATGDGRAFDSIFADLDFTKATLDLPEFGWTKPFDAAARGTFRYGRGPSGALVSGDIRGDGLELVGEATLDEANGVASARIERLYSRNGVDLRGDYVSTPEGAPRLTLTGPFFDASPFMDAVLGMTNTTSQPRTDPHASPPDDPAWEVALAVDRLRLREGADLRNVRLDFEMGADGPRRGVATGSVSDRQGVEVLIDTDGGARTVSISSDDAGFAARVLVNADYLVGGTMKLDGRFEGGMGSAQVAMSNVRLRKAPLVAQLLSLASLRGLADVLSGEGVLFTRIDAPVTMQAGRMDFPGVRASGPAMGLTARGWIAPAAGELSLDGVLVPSFGVNSALGGIPMIGDLFVSREGEGIFAPTYSVRGTFQKARVSVNPVAAITPGVLRRIFENPSAPPPDADPHGG